MGHKIRLVIQFCPGFFALLWALIGEKERFSAETINS